ncbi:MAG: hypothetical protein ACKO9G_15290, partial [Dolichospermum sp.]
FRKNQCKHQIAVQNFLRNQIQFVSPTDFGYWEAIVDGDIHNVIAIIEYYSDRDCDQSWWSVRMAKETLTFTSYEEAEQFIKGKYVEDYISNGRGSGRISEPVEDMGMTIEDSNFVHDFGQSYALRVHKVLAGYIWLNDDGWTLNGKDFNDDWRPVAKELAKLTKHLVAA